MEEQQPIVRPSLDASTIIMTDEGMPFILQGCDSSTQQVSFLRARVKYTDSGLTTQIGTLPRDAFLKSITIYTLSDFGGATAKFGKEPNGSDYGTAKLAAAGVEELELSLPVRNVPLEVENTIYMTRDKKSTKGDAEVIVEFYTNR
ncbi:hypothetical protein [Bartonella vinsonii]|uniref:Uncharacterized protein n=1 Tax=Bartonella vinsonii subsp. berkhoffii str. Tweed TaxID=1094502 RepID=N6VLD5_BARVB|nr:hypothetical protein [Bartonella vinsonii]ENN93991.1 hypothetical protein BVtw_14810 [Bartonella vinsonii subsp. berkhoffii str. Tweed]